MGVTVTLTTRLLIAAVYTVPAMVAAMYFVDYTAKLNTNTYTLPALLGFFWPLTFTMMYVYDWD